MRWLLLLTVWLCLIRPDYPARADQPAKVSKIMDSYALSAFFFTEDVQGELWLTGLGTQIARFHPVLQTVHYLEIARDVMPYQTCLGPDNNIWVAAGKEICRIKPAGKIDHFAIRPYGAICMVQFLCVGPDGNIWFTDSGSRIGRMDLKGTVTDFKAGLSRGARLRDICAGPDGNLWFLEMSGTIGKITPSGEVTEYPAGLGNTLLTNLCLGPDRHMWFTASECGAICRANPLGKVSQVNSEFLETGGLCLGPDHNMWFTEGSGKIGRITPRGQVSLFDGPFNRASRLGRVCLAANGKLYFSLMSGKGLGICEP